MFLIAAITRRRIRIVIGAQLRENGRTKKMQVHRESNMTLRTVIIPGIVVALLAGGGAAASAAPVAPPAGVAPTVLRFETVQFRGGNWGDHPLMYGGNWREHQREWDAFEGRGANASATPCARFRSYDRGSRTYVNRSGRRVPCPWARPSGHA